MPDLLSLLKKTRILIADGATGTMLQNAGLPAGMPPERWNLENPDGVTQHYRAYIEAGSDIILTNTFGGNSIRLQKDGLASEATNINRIAAQLARDAAGSEILVFGDIGPIGELIEPLGLLTESQAIRSFEDLGP